MYSIPTYKNVVVANSIDETVEIYPRLTVAIHDGIDWRAIGSATSKKVNSGLLADIEIYNAKFDIQNTFPKIIIDNNRLHSILLVNRKMTCAGAIR